MLTVFLVIISMLSSVTQNCIMNRASKIDLKTNNHIFYFNAILSLVCIAIFGVMLIGGKLSLFTVLVAVIFGVMTAMRSVYNMQALSVGPMNITIMITTSSTIIPTLSGIFFGEKFSLAKLILVFVLIGFICISLKSDGESNINKKWLFFAFLAFITQGLIGVLQKVHQASAYKGEVSGFLFITFIIAYIFNRFRLRVRVKELGFKPKYFLFAVICGLCTFSMNYLNLKLAGIIPSQIFFPVVNGGSMVLNQIMSVALFKERPTKKQIIGIVGGIATLIAICIVK